MSFTMTPGELLMRTPRAQLPGITQPGFYVQTDDQDIDREPRWWRVNEDVMERMRKKYRLKEGDVYGMLFCFSDGRQGGAAFVEDGGCCVPRSSVVASVRVR